MHTTFTQISKSCTIVLAAVLVLLIASGCVGFDPYAGKRPCDVRPSVWICSEYGMILEVSSSGETTVELDGHLYECDVGGPGVYFDILAYDQIHHVYTDILFRGECEYSKEKFCVTVLMDTISSQSLVGKTITFTKEHVNTGDQSGGVGRHREPSPVFPTARSPFWSPDSERLRKDDRYDL